MLYTFLGLERVAGTATAKCLSASFFLIAVPINRPLRSWLADSRRKAYRLGSTKWHLIPDNPRQPEIKKALGPEHCLRLLT
jgi:hypothetical protein